MPQAYTPSEQVTGPTSNLASTMYLYSNQMAVSPAVPVGFYTGPANKFMDTESSQEVLQTFLAMMASINTANNSNMANGSNTVSNNVETDSTGNQPTYVSIAVEDVLFFAVKALDVSIRINVIVMSLEI
ncbi:hypothetical protein F8M41_000656 [Gigaspora margarita]|uniref:Uncharacterized protein n=1 Tax=Gigaspora margarita TaxID=4874 RepID=A0A8H4AZE4_GIGMA|nr:hypothetical protein F8M41_000656 [Gigaspora margarita]